MAARFEDNIASPRGVDPNFRLNPYVGYGGGVCAESSAEVVFVDCNFVDNEADTGGGVYMADVNARVDDCNVLSNTALRGAGLACLEGSLSVTASTITENRAGADVNDANDPNAFGMGQGGGMYCFATPVDDS